MPIDSRRIKKNTYFLCQFVIDKEGGTISRGNVGLQIGSVFNGGLECLQSGILVKGFLQVKGGTFQSFKHSKVSKCKGLANKELATVLVQKVFKLVKKEGSFGVLEFLHLGLFVGPIGSAKALLIVLKKKL